MMTRLRGMKMKKTSISHKSPTPSQHHYSFNAVPTSNKLQNSQSHSDSNTKHSSLDLRITIPIIWLILLCFLYFPGLYFCLSPSVHDMNSDTDHLSVCRQFQLYITNGAATCIGIIFLFFVIQIAMKYRKINGVDNHNLYAIRYEHYGLNFELMLILCLIFNVSMMFAFIEYNYFHWNDELRLMLVLATWTLCGCLVVLILILTPLLVTRAVNRQYLIGKEHTKQCHLHLSDVLSYRQTFNAFTYQLAEEYNMENLAFLVEIWQFRSRLDAIRQQFHNQLDSHQMMQSNSINVVIDSNNSNASKQPNDELEILEMQIERHCALGRHRGTSVLREYRYRSSNDSTIATIADLAVDPLPTSAGSIHHLPLSSGSTFSELDVDAITNAISMNHESSGLDGDHNLCSSDDDGLDDVVIEHTECIDASPPMHSITMSGPTNQQEIERAVGMLSKLPWTQLPLADSSTKYEDHFAMALHIYNKYLSQTAFDSLNISEPVLTQLESTLLMLYAFKLKSYGIGIELDQIEIERKLDAQLAESKNHLMNHFDFVEYSSDRSRLSVRPSPRMSSNDTVSSVGSVLSFESGNDNKSSTYSLRVNMNLKQKTKIRQQLGLEMRFSAKALLQMMESDPIQNEEEFETKLMSLYDVCLPEVLQNLESPFTRFQCTEEYCRVLADHMQRKGNGKKKENS